MEVINWLWIAWNIKDHSAPVSPRTVMVKDQQIAIDQQW
jgi:hypothetical protein